MMEGMMMGASGEVYLCFVMSASRTIVPFNWNGSKAGLLNLILENMPPHDHYVEPFLGAATVYLNKPPAKLSTLNDIDLNIVTFFRVLQDRHKTQELLRHLRYTPYARAEYERACALLSGEGELDDVSRAWAFFVAQTMGFAHSYYHDPSGRRFGYDRKPSSTLSSYTNRTRQLIVVSERLRSAQIEHGNGLRVMERYDAEGVFMFVDPPYPVQTVKIKRSLYSSEYDNKLHEDLLNFVLKAKSKIMLASYPNEMYDELLKHGWRRIDKERRISAAVCTREMVRARSGTGMIRDRRVESLYINYRTESGLFG
mgnify:CR=1 FL=1